MNLFGDGGPGASSATPLFQWYVHPQGEDAARVRRTLQAWFERFPQGEAKGDLAARLVGKGAGANAAFFELYLHELLCCLGFEVEIHPPVPSGLATRPDFRIRRNGLRLFYLEAKLVGRSPRGRWD